MRRAARERRAERQFCYLKNSTQNKKGGQSRLIHSEYFAPDVRHPLLSDPGFSWPGFSQPLFS
jgi:hypothetical protein